LLGKNENFPHQPHHPTHPPEIHPHPPPGRGSPDNVKVLSSITFLLDDKKEEKGKLKQLIYYF
jgi:hypothetical protein